MLIRFFTIDDMDETTDLFIRAFSEEPWNDKWDYRSAREHLLEIIDRRRFFGYVAFIDRRIIGACLGSLKTWWNGDEYYIDEMFIDKGYKGKGIGTALINYVKEEAAAIGINTIILLTQKNSKPEHFYMRNSFNKNETICLMTCKL